MKVRELEKDDVRDAVRILVLSFERELFGIFGDVELARELFFEYFSLYPEYCYVAEEERIIGFASISFGKTKIGSFLRKKLGFVRGTKFGMLIKYLCPSPKKDEATINFVAVSPLRRGKGVGTALMEKLLEVAREKGKKKVKCYVSVENDSGIGLLTKFKFRIANMIDNSFAEKHFGQRKWYLMELELEK